MVYDLMLPKIFLNLCGGSFILSPFVITDDSWTLFTLYVKGANSFYAVDSTIDEMDFGTINCNPPLSLTILPRRAQEYDRIYLRDLIIYKSGMHPGSLLLIHSTY